MLKQAPDSSTQIVWVAGEKSGDLIAGPILQAVNQRINGVHHSGIGGPAMRDAGFDCWWDIDDYRCAVMQKCWVRCQDC